jgi:hypothetical protein
MSGQPTLTTLITTPFANEATNLTVIPVTPGSPGTACYQLGWQTINETPIASGGIPPKCEDFNGLFNAITQAVAWWTAGQAMPYNATLATALSGYALGAIVSRADGTGSWINMVAGNTTNPDTGGANWQGLDNVGLQQFTLTNANITLTPAQASRNVILLQGTLTGNVQITFPAWAGNQWLVVNATTGAFAVTATTSGGTPIALQQGGGNSYSVLVWCDGTNLYLTNVGPQSNSFPVTAAVDGTFSGSPVVEWTRSGNSVTMTLPNVVVTSTGTSFALIGIPAALIPPSYATIQQQFPLANANDNSAHVADCSLYLSIVSGTPEIIFQKAGSPTGWTASGTKYALLTWTYNLGL